ncbi:alpha/beta hydrolase [Empedobacter brevis]|uniref:Alpha/beta hydrolase n=2 Tax=Empedobacter brevis TaxID=247 RepID=A0A511NDQ6_9FLAO|nr:alpha/beta hydrolase [Empedobacter brevis]MDM1071119.1 alpha/beta hydrolase [Empedobacter brevis]QES93476.1 alpha/beta hydrolase [Empedobacter brevis]GEM50461.1 alpha/beta hydrolase [Empedobacter brevis NBRC 14943 = ATCC 43319]
MLAHTTYTHPTSTEWVTFVHGAGGSSTIWFKQIREFRKHFNILLLDLRGHGRSKNNLKSLFEKRYTFKSVAKDVIEVLDHLKIKQTHFVGMSLGTIVIRQLAEDYSDRFRSMVMGGAIMKMNYQSRFLMTVGNLFKHMIPYLVLYRIFAFAIMPRSAHKESRNLFINEAKKLYQKEFLKWFKLTADINPLLKWFREVELNIPTLYVMGAEDHMFLPSIQQLIKTHKTYSELIVIDDCGHVVNVDQPQLFNDKVIAYINRIK